MLSIHMYILIPPQKYSPTAGLARVMTQVCIQLPKKKQQLLFAYALNFEQLWNVFNKKKNFFELYV